MKDELFNDLLDSAKEMVAIEKGELVPASDRVHEFDSLDVRALRQATGKTQVEFASLIGASPDCLRSWEGGRRVPSGSARKLLMLINTDPKKMTEILTHVM